MDIQDRIHQLKAEFRRDQDPSKMGRIQSQIGVSFDHAAARRREADEQELMLQINVIREKAAEAEAIVKGITGDIQRLDVAKRNLTGAIQTLERWEMLSAPHTDCDEYC